MGASPTLKSRLGGLGLGSSHATWLASIAGAPSMRRRVLGAPGMNACDNTQAYIPVKMASNLDGSTSHMVVNTAMLHVDHIFTAEEAGLANERGWVHLSELIDDTELQTYLLSKSTATRCSTSASCPLWNIDNVLRINLTASGKLSGTPTSGDGEEEKEATDDGTLSIDMIIAASGALKGPKAKRIKLPTKPIPMRSLRTILGVAQNGEQLLKDKNFHLIRAHYYKVRQQKEEDFCKVLEERDERGILLDPVANIGADAEGTAIDALVAANLSIASRLFAEQAKLAGLVHAAQATAWTGYSDIEKTELVLKLQDVGHELSIALKSPDEKAVEDMLEGVIGEEENEMEEGDDDGGDDGGKRGAEVILVHQVANV